MYDLLYLIYFLFGGLLLADFQSGFFHWMEDNYFTPFTPFIGNIILHNRIHHVRPYEFTIEPFYVTVRSSVLLGLVQMLVLLAIGKMNLFLLYVTTLTVLSNQIHKLNHLPPSSSPLLVRLLQRMCILQIQRQHLAHHRGSFSVAYCVITPFLNPILDIIGFWKALEKCVDTSQSLAALGVYI